MNTNKSVSPTHTATKSSAEICRQRGWIPGQVIEGTQVFQFEGKQRVDRVRIVITAVGEREILARNVGDPAHCEALWDLHCREWEAVG